MKNGVKFFLGLLVGLAISGAVVGLSIFLWNWVNPVTDIAHVSSTANPASDLDALAIRVEQLEAEQEYQLKVFEWKQDQKLLVLGWTALFISFVAAFVGIKTYNDLDKVIREKVNSILEKELYQLDPTNMPIHLVVHDEMKVETERIWKRLEMTGLNNCEKIMHLDKKCRQGITILLVKNKDEENKLAKWLKAHRLQIEGDEPSKERYLDPQKAAFVVYTPPSKWLDDDTLTTYDNLATGNMPATIASMVLVVGRGIRNSV